MTRSSYSTDVVCFVCVTDLDLAGTRSVTNDIEHVIADLVSAGKLRSGDRLLYRDSEGQWDEVRLDDKCRFVSFGFIGATSRTAAMIESLSRAPREA